MNNHYTTALDQALTWIDDNFKTVGVIVSGSIIRGKPDDNSDFDIYIIHDGSFRQRLQKFFNGVPCEIFVNNPGHIYGYFESELKNNRPVTASILATGKVFKGNDNPDIQKLLAKAKEFASKSPERTEQQNVLTRYCIANLYEDATDLLEIDEITAAYFLDRTVLECIDFTFLLHGNPLPRAKERINQLLIIQPEVGRLVKNYYQCSGAKEKHKIAGQVMIILIGKTGFFEWSTLPE